MSSSTQERRTSPARGPMAVGAPAIASTPTSPAPGDAAPVATRSVTISWSCAWTFVPAMLL